MSGNWGQVQEGLTRGFAIGQAAGGKLSGLGMAIGKIADSMKESRVAREEMGQKQNILGYAGMTEGKIVQAQPNEEGAFQIPGIGWMKKASSDNAEMIDKLMGGRNGSSNLLGQANSDWKVNKIDVGPATLERTLSPEENQQANDIKANQEATIAVAKERQLNISKVGRLGNLANVLEKRFAETSPHGGLLGPISGGIDLMLSNLQITPNQINDTAYRSFVKGLRAQLARALGDVGNLSEPEQKAAMNLVPTLMDSKQTAAKKLSNLRDLISTIKANSQTSNQSQDNDPLGLR